MVEKLKYEAPELVEIGSFEDITQTNNVGTLLDVSLPSGSAPITS